MTNDETLAMLRAIVGEQAKEEMLWCQSAHITEAALQRALRQLHEIIEGKSSAECALDVLLETTHRVDLQ